MALSELTRLAMERHHSLRLVRVVICSLLVVAVTVSDNLANQVIMRMPGAVMAATLAVLATACGSDGEALTSSWAGTVAQDGDVRMVRNPSSGILDSAQLQVREVWRFDPAEHERGSLVWAQPSRIIAVADAFYVVDTPEAHVYVLSAEGEWVQTLGGRGGGPGEFRRPIGVIQLGSSVAVIDGGKASAELFDVDGTFQRNVNLGMMAFNAVPLDSTSFAVYGLTGSEGSWRSFDLDGSQRPFSLSASGQVAEAGGCEHTTSGKSNVLVLRCEIPRLLIYGTDGRLQQQIDIARDSVMASKEELDRFAAQARQEMGNAGLPPATIQEVLDGQLAAMRVKQLYWLSADGLYLGDTYFSTGWEDAALANGQLVVLAPDAATGVMEVIAFALEDAARLSQLTVPKPPRSD